MFAKAFRFYRLTLVNITFSTLLLLFLAASAQCKSSHQTQDGSTLAGTGSQSQGMKPAMTAMPLVIPLFMEDQQFTSSLVLLNGTETSNHVDLILRESSGQEIVRKRVDFAAHSQERVEIADLLLKAGSSAKRGSIIILQGAELSHSMNLAQLEVTYRGAKNLNYLDEEVAMPNMESSGILRAVTDDANSSPIVAITELEGQPQNIQVECLGVAGRPAHQSLHLGANQTVLTEPCTGEIIGSESLLNMPDSEERRSEPVGINLVSDGMPLFRGIRFSASCV